MKKPTAKQIINSLAPILKAYNLRANRPKELRQARKINNEIEEKVFKLINVAGI